MSSPIVIGLTSRTIFNLPAWIAQDKGYFAEAGLDVRLHLFNSGDASREALLGGEIQFAFAAPEAVLIDVYLRDGSLRIVGGNARRLPHFIIAQPRFKKVEDLRGATIGVISDHEGTTYIVPTIAAAHGLPRDSYTISAVGGAPKRWKLLQAGEIDAGLQPFPLCYEAEAAGFSNLGWAGKYEPDWQFTALSADSRWTEAHREETVALLRALRQGSDHIAADPDDSARIGAREMEAPVALTRRSIEDEQRLGILDLHWSEAGIARIFRVLQQSGIIPESARFDISRVTDASYLGASERHA